MDKLTKPVRCLIIYWCLLIANAWLLYMKTDERFFSKSAPWHLFNIIVLAALIILSTKPNENPN